MGTKIQLHFGDAVIPATLNDSTAAKEFLKQLSSTFEREGLQIGIVYVFVVKL